jgi:S1-C subfamily serine protease
LASVPLTNIAEGKFGASFKDLRDATTESVSVIVTGVEKGSVSDNSGIRPGDVILKFNGEQVENSKSLINMMNRAFGDGNAIFSIRRGDTIAEFECGAWENQESR